MEYVFTKEEAKILKEFYTPLIMGKPIKGNRNDILITEIEIKDFGSNEYGLFCIAKYGFDVFNRKISEYIEEFNIISPNDVLNGQSQ